MEDLLSFFFATSVPLDSPEVRNTGERQLTCKRMGSLFVHLRFAPVLFGTGWNLQMERMRDVALHKKSFADAHASN